MKMGAENSAHAVVLNGVSLTRSKKQILKGINWKIERGSNWVVLGANGSGKTTLLKVIAGYLWPTKGTVTVFGNRFGSIDLRKLRKRIGWIGSFLQEFIPEKQTSRQVIMSAFKGTIGWVFEQEDYNKKVKEKTEETAEILGCSHILDKPYGLLSQGEKQRILLARALVNHPELLLLDEPCAGLDIVAREIFLKLLYKLKNHNGSLTIIYVTHHIEEIFRLFDHALIIKDGKVVAQGVTENVINHENLKEAFGLPVTIRSENGRYWLQCDPVNLP